MPIVEWKPTTDAGRVLGQLVQDELPVRDDEGAWQSRFASNINCCLPARGVSTADIGHAKELATMLADALQGNDRYVLDKLPHILALLHGMPDRTAKLAFYGSCIASCIETRDRDIEHTLGNLYTGRRGDGYMTDLQIYERFCPLVQNMLVASFDPAFAKLTPGRIAEALLSVPADGAKRGGAGNVGATRVAAELAVEAEAFGFGGGDYDSDVELALRDLRAAAQRHKTRQQSKPY